MKVLILGNGLLGSEIKKQTGWDSISRSTHDIDFKDVTSCYRYFKDYDVILNCIAHTDTYDKNKNDHWDINFKAVSRLCDWCYDNNKKLVQISTDFVYANSSDIPNENDIPVHAENWYSYTKVLADGYIELKGKDWLIIRCGHKPTPFPYEKAYTNIIGNFDYVDVIASKIINLIKNQKKGIYNVGTERKSIYELAQQTTPSVEPGYSEGSMPTDIRMNCKKMDKEL